MGEGGIHVHHASAAVRPWGWETIVFRGATVVALLHALDDAFLNRQPGVGLGQHAVAALVALVAGVGAIAAFPRVRVGLRGLIALVFGIMSSANGAQHALYISVTASEGATCRALPPSSPA